MSTNEGDRELLELAAKAGGIPIDSYIYSADDDGYVFTLRRRNGVWNSLLFSGDALELAVTLGIIIRPFNNHHQGSQVVASVHPLIEEREYAADHDHDLKAATLYAVTRAAAEIGKAMP